MCYAATIYRLKLRLGSHSDDILGLSEGCGDFGLLHYGLERCPHSENIFHFAGFGAVSILALCMRPSPPAGRDIKLPMVLQAPGSCVLQEQPGLRICQNMGGRSRDMMLHMVFQPLRHCVVHVQPGLRIGPNSHEQI